MSTTLERSRPAVSEARPLSESTRHASFTAQRLITYLQHDFQQLSGHMSAHKAAGIAAPNTRHFPSLRPSLCEARNQPSWALWRCEQLFQIHGAILDSRAAAADAFCIANQTDFVREVAQGSGRVCAPNVIGRL